MTPKQVLGLCLLVLLVGQGTSLYLLNRLSYLRLPSYDASSNDQVYKLFGGTAEESAYDANEQILYVVGEESYVLHIIDMSNPRAPAILMEHRFLVTDGVPRDVEVCGTRVVVSLSSPVAVYDGHVKFFRAYDRVSQTFAYESQLPVGVFPDNIKFTSGCSKLIVANEGRHGKDPFNRFSDPEGSVSIISIPTTGSPTERIADFNQFNSRQDIRHVSAFAPNSEIMRATLAQDLEPEYIAVSSDGNTAYVTLQENNAIAQLDLRQGIVTQLFNLGTKDWSDLQLDASDRDGGIHPRSFPIRGLYQPDGLKTFSIGRRNYLVTVNEGAVKSYTKEIDGLVWSDGVLADSLGRGNHLNEIAINNQTFINELSQDSRLGRLLVSSIDGATLYGLQSIHTYGGRGFSIWETSKMSEPVYDSADDIQKINSQAFKTIFNTDCAAWTNQSPETLRDTTSDNMGPKLNAIDIVNDNGTILMALGSETMGVVYLYVINTTTLTPELQNVKYEGGTSDLWSELYDNSNAGNAYISDIGIIKASQSPNNQTLVYVVSNGSGSVAVYSVTDKPSVSNPLG
ncbi:mesenchyme-specific cell surface glycoprotein [Patella vulgata]|uniref:mesenchyme-specific cell surface glycoprotein n=1 Tax=Patella vulgata TaxID=6465 RepID=UPI0024A8DF5D|nr:mesenchyme-specific cell surface glycoprotein [Patella vulgata]